MSARCEFKRAAFFLICVLLGVVGSLKTVTAQDIVVRPPLGFDHDDSADLTLIDIVYRGRQVAATPARFDADTISFDDPAGLIAALPGLREPDRVRRAFDRPLATNSELLCSNPIPAQDCNFIQTSTVAVIFDEARLSAEVFISSRFTTRLDPRDQFVPPPTVAPAVLSFVDTRTAYNFDTDQSVGNHRVRAVAGRGRIALRAEGFADADFSGQVTAMYATHSGEDRAWSAGLLPPRATGGLARSRRMFGFRFGTLLDSRTDRNQLLETPIEVSVAQSATIELQRDGQTLDVQQIEPGQTQLETRRLPPGSYAIDLIIKEGGQTRTETRFYSSNARLPPANAPRWYVELGNAVPLRRRSDGFEDDDPTAIALGWAQRLGPNLGVRADGFLSNEVSFLELETGFRAAAWRGDASMLLADDGGTGFAIQLNGDLLGYQMRSSYRSLDRSDDTIIASSDAFDPIPNSFEQGSVSVSRSGRFGRFGARGFYRKNSAGRVSWFGGPYADVPVFNARTWRLNLNARAELGSDRNSVFFGVRLAKRFGDRQRIQLSSRIDTRTVNPHADERVSTQLQHETEIRVAQQWAPKVDSSVFAGVRYEDVWGARVGADIRAPWVRANLDARHNYQRQNTGLLSLETGAILNAAGVSFAHRDAETGARVSLLGPRGLPAPVLVDGARRVVSQTGQTSFVPLEAYTVADVGIQPASSDDLAYDQSADRFVAYPGNVIQVRRALEPVRIFVGQLVDQAGQPIANALLRRGAIIGKTDSAGYYQIDGAAGQSITAETVTDSRCTFVIADHQDTDRAFIDLGRTICD
ncbi:MAG: TcfC E-set like domain-containing protein [Pseudomonadota bacterium]